MTGKDYHIRTDCRLCGGALSDKLVDFGSTALANEYPATAEEGLAQDRFPLYLVQCVECLHVQLPVVVVPKRLFNKEYAYSSSTSPVFRKHLDGLADRLCDHPCRKTVLEIGSNDGYLVRALRDRSMEAFGVDPCADDSYPALPCFFTRALGKILRPVDCVVAINVFAHIDDLAGCADAIREVLTPAGCFAFEVGYLPDVLERWLADVVYAEHVSYHHLRPLLPFLESHGLYMYDAERVETQGGSIRVWASRERAVRMSERLLGLLEAEHNIAPRRLAQAVRIIDWEYGGSRPGTMRTPAFGAPAKLTTFLAAARRYRPACVYDDNPRKVGRYVPGTDIPIVPARQLLEDNPPSVVVTAWNFFDDISERLRAWGYQGKLYNPMEFSDYKDDDDVA